MGAINPPRASWARPPRSLPNACTRGISLIIVGIGCLLVVGTFTATPTVAADIVVDTLADVADPPFNADDLCGVGTPAELPGADGFVSLREAIVATNHVEGPHIITFAAPLAGGTVSVVFDDLDGDTIPDPLPFLCGGDTTIDGDTNGDAMPDITVAAGAGLPAAALLNVFSSGNTIEHMRVEDSPTVGILVFHPFFHSAEAAAVNNTIRRSVIRGGTYPIVVEASFDVATAPGVVSNTVVTENTLSGGELAGILVFTGDGVGSLIDATTITNNQVVDNPGFGILVTTSLTAAGNGSRITQTTVRDNEVAGNGLTGIGTFGFSGHDSEISAIVIDRNNVHDNGFGISASAGVCGAARNEMEVTLSRNTLGTSGIFVSGGTNVQCGFDPLPVASENQMVAAITENILNDRNGPGITLAGGTVNAAGNSLEATVSRNRVVGLIAMTLAGGQGISGGEEGPADRNMLTATVRENFVGRGFAGIGVAGGASGEANDNRVDVVVEANTACGSTVSDIQYAGGFAGALGVPANQGSLNVVTGRISGNLANRIVVEDGVDGNTADATQENNSPCRAGDATCNGRVTSADIAALVSLIADGKRAMCELDDARADGVINADDITATVRAIFA